MSIPKIKTELTYSKPGRFWDLERLADLYERSIANQGLVGILGIFAQDMVLTIYFESR
jgi:hypothetical protein